VDGGRDVALVPLVVAADVDPDGPVDRLGLAGIDLLDLALDLLEKFPVARHCFKKDSSEIGPSRHPLAPPSGFVEGSAEAGGAPSDTPGCCRSYPGSYPRERPACAGLVSDQRGSGG